MKIRCWGARGSIPVSGREYVAYGGDTCCMEVTGTDGSVVVIDTGSGARRLGRKLASEGVTDFSVIFTHAHWDHISGFPFFLPLYRKDTRISFYGCPFAQRSIRQIISATMEPPYFPVQMDGIRASLTFTDLCLGGFTIGSMEISPILLSHPNEGIGYRFSEGGKSFVFLTDNELGHRHPGGLSFREYLDFCRGADLLIHDAEYTGEEYPRRKGWGHSCYAEALDLALQAGVGTLGLFHHNQERTDGEIEAIVSDCRSRAAAAGSSLHCFAATQETEIEL